MLFFHRFTTSSLPVRDTPMPCGKPHRTLVPKRANLTALSIPKDSCLLWGDQLVGDTTPAHFPGEQRTHEIDQEQIGNENAQYDVNPRLTRDLRAGSLQDFRCRRHPQPAAYGG